MNRIEPPIYEKYVDEITDAFVKDMKKKYGLICEGSGGSMPNKVYALSLRFVSYQHATIEEARELLVTSAKMLIDRVNAHEKIRPYLNEYPFTWRGANIAIAFHNEKGGTDYYLDGSVAMVYLTRKGFVAYDRAELQKRKLVDCIHFDGTVTPGEVIEREVLIDLMEEPYEEAVKIVERKQLASG